MEKIKNIISHPVIVEDEDGNVIATFPSEGSVWLPQCTFVSGEVETEGGVIPLTSTEFGEAQEIPPEEEDTLYIASLRICQACPDRRDFLIPNHLVLDEEGRELNGSGGEVRCRSLTPNPYAFHSFFSPLAYKRGEKALRTHLGVQYYD